jgi:Fe-S oxidoreductase
METITQLRQATGAVYCQDCGKCTSRCPLAGDGDFSPRLITMQDPDEEARGQGVGVNRCLTCGSCEIRCPQGVNFTDYVRGLRELLPDADRRPCPHKGIFQAIARSMATSTPERKMDWLGDLKVAEKGEVALFVGCLPFFDAYFGDSLGLRTLDIARSAIRVLNEQGIEPVLATDERCCGHDLLWGGEEEAFDSLAKANAENYAERGVKHLLTTCAECCRTWQVDYPKHVPGYAPKVQHFAEFLAEKVEGGAVRFQADGASKVTFQDPCRLSRHLGVVDAPRKVLDALPEKELVEMERSGEDAMCCGTSGFLHCDATSKEMQSDRLGEARSTGADTLVTACPKCLIHFSCAQSEDRRNGHKSQEIQVTDFTVLAASMLEKDGANKTDVPADDRQDTGETR